MFWTLDLRIKKTTIWNFLSLLSYKIVLDLSYYFIISPVWAHAKFGLYLNSIKLAESYFLLFVVFTLMPKSPKKLSNVMVWLLILFSYIPMLTIFALKDESRIYMYAVTVFWVVVFLLLHIHIPTITSLPLLKQAKTVRYSIFIGLSIIVLYMIYKYLGFSFNFDLTKVYDIRARFVKVKIPLAGYLFNWSAYIVNPVFFAIFIQKKKWIYTAIVIVIQLLLFSATGNKIFLFALPYVFALTWVVTHKNPLFYMAIGFTGIIMVGMLSYWLINDVWISSLFTRRTLLVPANLSFLYYDFFSKNEFVFLSHSIFRFFLNYPYHLDPPHLMGEVYYNNPKTSANTGIYGDAFMNFGFFGLILWGILLVIILKLIDTFSKGKESKLRIAAIAIPVITLTNSALLTNLLTHGLLLGLILLYLLPKEKVSVI